MDLMDLTTTTNPTYCTHREEWIQNLFKGWCALFDFVVYLQLKHH